ncbi:beta-lactamase hydrolase domain-containing protein [Achromobacter ruhlandii]|uniref:beta-lactamase hydrolase domain-containing protein n=1 Tax=Achromobacter ruhlandii TaxID=72557 RepID=UPI003D24F011
MGERPGGPHVGPTARAGGAAPGHKGFIINRPDFEVGPAQPPAADVSKAAAAAGRKIEYQPVVGSAMTAADVVRFAELLRTLPGPVLAYCRTGTRCTNLFAAAQQLG